MIQIKQKKAVGLDLRSKLFNNMILLLQNEEENIMYMYNKSFETIYYTKITQHALSKNLLFLTVRLRYTLVAFILGLFLPNLTSVYG